MLQDLKVILYHLGSTPYVVYWLAELLVAAFVAVSFVDLTRFGLFVETDLPLFAVVQSAAAAVIAAAWLYLADS